MKLQLSWILLALVFQFCRASPGIYNVGTGIADVTGPAAGVNMMGYAAPGQVSSGIHMRQYARTFIIDDGANRIVYVNIDCGMIDQAIKTEVVNRLKMKFNSTYSVKNVLLSGTHTHSGPGGFLQYLLFTITSFGFVKQTFDALVSGTVLSIERAHNNMKEANIYYSRDVILDANINRSPTSYLRNPAEERAKFEYDTDKDIVQLKFVSASDGQPIGLLNWYAVHLTSMNNTNTLISSDNKGYAALRFEAQMNGEAALPGKGPFIAAFGQSNLGDVSPNTKGARCIDTGLPCDLYTSTCNNRTAMCIASGPGKDMMDSTRIIGTKQFEKASAMFNQETDAMEALEGPIQFTHQFVDMPKYEFNVEDPVEGTKKVKLCKPAMGYSFAAGTTDGPGAFDFTQGTNTSNPFWNFVSGLIKKPSKEQINCHYPKPILLSTGEITFPYLWAPQIVETQILRLGQLLIAAVPGEFTTMAGRRLRQKISQEAGQSNVKVVIAGLSNVYTHYITTFEEYQAQRYEGASNIFGPYAHAAYLDQYAKLTHAIFNGTSLEDGPEPPYLVDKQISLLPGVIFDKAPKGTKFGDCVDQPAPTVQPSQTVTATFIAGHPRNNLMTENTFLKVEKQDEKGKWHVVATDAHFETTFSWHRIKLAQSEAHIRWMVPENAAEGNYRISHFGYHKNTIGLVLPYHGTSNTFTVKA